MPLRSAAPSQLQRALPPLLILHILPLYLLNKLRRLLAHAVHRGARHARGGVRNLAEDAKHRGERRGGRGGRRAALPGGGVGLFLVDGDATGVTRKSYRTHDGQRAAQISFSDVAAEPLGDGSDATAAIVASEVKAQAALCAEAVGAMEEALRLTTDYLKQRKQFGVPLAKFQALTFRAADMYVLLELARSMALYATMNLADDVVDPMVASRAKLQISRSSRKLGQEAIQLHGGIGVTAEYPVGHYVSRLVAIEHTLGGVDEHLRVLIGG